MVCHFMHYVSFTFRIINTLMHINMVLIKYVLPNMG